MVQRALSTLPRTLHVVGEISNFKTHVSGHVYFTLKDAASELACVMWRSAAATLRFRPQDGLEVIATGSVDVFERSGRYQLYVQRLEPRGIGALELAFRRLREKLEAQGLFDPARKRPLPSFPSRIAVVTSPTGAAIRDILRTLERRFPCVEVLVVPVPVQGEGAALQSAAAWGRVNLCAERLGGIDLIIVGRGGGSLEDLWAFNEEVVVRAIHASRIPVISAVGHEVDVTLSDLVADVRAATPTAAAELAVPVLADVLDSLATHARRLSNGARRFVELERRSLNTLERRPPFPDPLRFIRQREQLLDEWTSRSLRRLVARLHDTRRRLLRLDQIVARIAPHAALGQTRERLRAAEDRLRWAFWRNVSALHQRVGASHRRLVAASPQRTLVGSRERMASLVRRLQADVRSRWTRAADRVQSLDQWVHAMGYRSVLGRGFSITRLKKGRIVVRNRAQLADGQRLVTELLDDEVESDVRNLRQLDLFDPPRDERSQPGQTSPP